MIKNAIATIINHQDLTFEISEQVVNEIMNGDATDIEIAGFLTALAMKKPTIDEIAGAAKAMRDHALEFNANEPTLEIVGTGGDKSNSFNISTTAAFVVAAAGVPVAKHGNRAASSKSGAADVLEALHVKIDNTPERSEEILHDINLTFMFAQEYHKAMRYVAPARKQLGIPTIFNILGPLANPANAQMQLLGVYSDDLLVPMAHVLARLGVTNVMVVHGEDGLDEISAAAPTHVIEIKDGQFHEATITPEQFGLTRCAHTDLIGGTANENAAITKHVLAGETGPQRDVVLMNAAAAIHIARPDLSLQESFDLAETAIDSGRANEELDAFVRLSQEVPVQ